MKKLLFFIALLMPLAVFAQQKTSNTVTKPVAKKTTQATDSLQKKKVIVKKKADSSITTASAIVQDSVKKTATKKTAKPVKPTDSLTKKPTSKKAVKQTDSLSQQSIKKTAKPVDSLSKKNIPGKKGIKPTDSLAKKNAKKSAKVDSAEKQLPKGWFEISGADSTDIKESLLKKNAEEWFSDWFSITNERNQGFKASVPDSINKDAGYFRGHGTYAIKDTLSQGRISSIKMDYKTEVRVKGKFYQYRFYDFKIKSVLNQNGKVVIDEMIDLEAEKEKYKQTKDAFKGWRLKKIQAEMQNITDNFQAMMQQVPQRLNVFE